MKPFSRLGRECNLVLGLWDFAIVGVRVALTTTVNGICKAVRISLGSVAATPVRARAAGSYLKGKKLTEREIERAASKANEDADPPSDMHGSRDYRMDMIGVFTKRALKLALSRVQ
jgi:carbon-monoxide dehydrogenase medium subunit